MTTPLYEALLAKYMAGQIPWDAEAPPPEAQSLVNSLPPGRALDLGCGYGRASIYLAGRGWEVDGVDFIAVAIEEARTRARAAGVQPRFHRAAVTDLSFLTGPYDLALDVGCLHALDETELAAYANELRRLLRPGGWYLLFARLREEGETVEEQDRPHGLEERTIYECFADGFHLERIERGATAMPDGWAAWPSAWFWFRRDE
ncbi:MAG: class I SAM-dependent methyltransferase [Chloroflexota bacterium]